MIVIVEGIDNIGKDSLINGIMSHFSQEGLKFKEEVIHFTSPQGNTFEEKRLYQEGFFRKQFQKQLDNPKSFYFWNRSHLGEYIYGNLYRNTDSNWIFDLEKEYLEKFKQNDIPIMLFMLEASAEFSLNNDDGKSLANSLEKRNQEIALFNDAFEKTQISKKTKYNVQKNKFDFIPLEQRIIEFNKFIFS
jgi:thymidylate kinase